MIHKGNLTITKDNAAQYEDLTRVEGSPYAHTGG